MPVPRAGRQRDFLYITVAVGVIFGVLFLYAGNWPPIVVVETNSMMHVNVAEYTTAVGDVRDKNTGFGRLGTMDPGDIVLVKGVDDREDVATFAASSERHYGARGDVVAYRRPGDDTGVVIIHRAMTYVEVGGSGAARTYRVDWSASWREAGDCVGSADAPPHVCVFDAGGVTIEELGLVNKAFTRSGFITKGDNAASNPGADQAGRAPLTPEPVDLPSIVGKGQLELPALGLLKLALSGQTIKNSEMQQHDYFIRIGNVVAPTDLWALVGAELVLLSVAPFFVAAARDYLGKPGREVVPELSVLEDAWREREAERAARTIDRAKPKAP